MIKGSLKGLLRKTLVGLIALLLLILNTRPGQAQELKTTYNPFISNFDYYLSDAAYEYRAEYDVSDNPIYEGWTEWEGETAATDENIWRISQNTFDGTNRTHTTFAGTGDFEHAWDNRTTYFAEYFLLIDGSNYLLIDATNKLRIQ